MPDRGWNGGREVATYLAEGDHLLSIYYVLGRNFDIIPFTPLKTILQMRKLRVR